VTMKLRLFSWAALLTTGARWKGLETTGARCALAHNRTVTAVTA
jgi:hypothetical protein